MSRAYKDFDAFFKKATGEKPYRYQKILSKSDMPSVINVPTGAGKTEAAILGLWLWRRVSGHDVPRKLVYCLPRRTLSEQTQKRVNEWLQNLGLEGRIGVELLMGGSEDRIEEMLPNKEYVIIGTQDMLVSGALNRAYGNSPYTWPIVFGMLNNDSMWVMDEVQIMENALPTSIQLDYFRNRFKTFGPRKSVWMSATVDQGWLKTVDSSEDKPMYRLGDEDADEPLRRRNRAAKTLHRSKTAVKNTYSESDIQNLLSLPGVKEGPTAIIVNTVKRAQDVYSILSKERDGCKLIHSRFRAREREQLNEWLGKFNVKGGQIVVATQVLEAGVDVSFKTLVTEIAPWPSMIQRFGRCNRTGDDTDSRIYWVDLDDKSYGPYESDDIDLSRSKLKKLEKKSVSPADVGQVDGERIFDAVLRRKDLLSMFDTTPDLSGSHIDVSRFVRTSKQQLDVSVFWRHVDDVKDEHKPDAAEICNVHIGRFREFLGRKHGYIWNHADRKWDKIRAKDVLPGQTIMLESKFGGYSEALGWDGGEESVAPVTASRQVPDSHDGDKSTSSVPVELDDHTAHVLHELERFLSQDRFLDNGLKEALLTAARYHDVGKAHHVFQSTMQKSMTDASTSGKLWAKPKSTGKNPRHERPGFRHEVASTLAYLKQDRDDELRDLIAYLIMSHHGKVRMALRSVSKKERQQGRYLLGMDVKGDTLQGFKGKTVSIKGCKMDMSLASIGGTESGASWTQRVLALLERYGPFRLGYLEALLRRADWLASQKEAEGKY